MNDTVPYRIPQTWQWAELGDIAEIVRVQVNPQLKPRDKFNYLSIENVEANTGELVNFTPSLGKGIKSAKIAFTTGDILYSKLRPYLNKVHLPIFDGISATDLIPIRPLGRIQREYLGYFLRTAFVVEYANQKTRGIQLPRLPVDDLLKLPVPVAPIPEQGTIVGKIEKGLVEIRAAKRALRKVRDVIRQFRQSVLARAFRGDLTDREPSDEPAEKLLEKMRQEHRRGSEERLQMKAKDPKKYGYESQSMDVLRLGELPRGWVWTTIAELTDSSFYGPRFARDEYTQNGVVTIRTTDITDRGEIVLNNPPRFAVEREQIEHFGWREGDLLVARSGSIGKCSIFEPLGEPAIPGAYLIRFRLYCRLLPPRYVLYYLLSPMGQSLLTAAATAVTQANINAEKILHFPIPIAPEHEMRRIVSRIQIAQTGADTVEEQVKTTTASTTLLEQSILHYAFRGALVQQNPEDEPASVLLERIRASRTAMGRRENLKRFW